MQLDYVLTGVVNEDYLHVEGTGEIDQSTGTFNLNLDLRFVPPGWDPWIIILICCDNLRLYCAKTDDGAVESLRRNLNVMRFGGSQRNKTGGQPSRNRSGYIYDASGEVVAYMKAKGFLLVENNRALSRTVVFDGVSALNKFGGIKSINTPYQEHITPLPGFGANGLSKYEVTTCDGSVLEGFTSYPYVFESGTILAKPLTLEISAATLNSIGSAVRIAVQVGVL